MALETTKPLTGHLIEAGINDNSTCAVRALQAVEAWLLEQETQWRELGYIPDGTGDSGGEYLGNAELLRDLRVNLMREPDRLPARIYAPEGK